VDAAGFPKGCRDGREGTAGECLDGEYLYLIYLYLVVLISEPDQIESTLNWMKGGKGWWRGRKK